MLLRSRVLPPRDLLRRCSLAARRLSSQGSPSDEQKWRTQVMPALETFRREMGHCAIDEDFEVPSTCPWPQEAWGFPLGRVVRDIRESRAYVDQVARGRAELELLHFPWVHQATVWNDRILPALEVYASEFGHCRVPFMFVVPSRAPWPRGAWGMNLGTMVASMRGMGSYLANVGRDADRLELLGYSLELSTRVWKKCIAPLLEVHATVFGEEVPVSADFVIPREDPWPEEMWGVRLGMIVARNSRLVTRTNRGCEASQPQ